MAAGDLKRITAPLLLVAGLDDPPSLKSSRQLVQFVSNTRLIEIPGVDHIRTMSDSRTLNAVATFLRDSDTSGS